MLQKKKGSEGRNRIREDWNERTNRQTRIREIR